MTTATTDHGRSAVRRRSERSGHASAAAGELQPVLRRQHDPARDGSGTGQGNVPGRSTPPGRLTVAKSLKAGPLANGQSSIIRFRHSTLNGTLTYKAILEASCCGEQLDMWIDGVHSAGVYSRSSQWVTVDRYLSAGVHTIERQFSRSIDTVRPPAHVDR